MNLLRKLWNIEPYITLAPVVVLTLWKEGIPLFCRDPQGRPVVSLHTSGVTCWWSLWISLLFCYCFKHPFVTPSNLHILWNNWTRAHMAQFTEGSWPARGIISQRCRMNILNWNRKLPKWWKALIVLSLGDFHKVCLWLGFSSCQLHPYHFWSPPPFFHSFFPLTQLTSIPPSQIITPSA